MLFCWTLNEWRVAPNNQSISLRVVLKVQLMILNAFFPSAPWLSEPWQSCACTGISSLSTVIEVLLPVDVSFNSAVHQAHRKLEIWVVASAETAGLDVRPLYIYLTSMLAEGQVKILCSRSNITPPLCSAQQRYQPGQSMSKGVTMNYSAWSTPLFFDPWFESVSSFWVVAALFE